MSRRDVKLRSPWEDRFRNPTVDELRAGMTRQHSQLFDTARDCLRAFESVQETLVWRGIPWRWSLAYPIEGDANRILAYLIPQPGKPQLAVPLTVEMIAALPQRRLPRMIRDAITFSARVAGIHWPCWELQSRPQIDELIGLAKRKHEFGLSAV